NSLGEVVGASTLAGNENVLHAYRIGANETIGAGSDLGTLGGDSSVAYAINNLGQVVGFSNIAGSTDIHAFLHTNGTMFDLNNLVAANAFDGFSVLAGAFNINDSGQIVGSGLRADGTLHAFLATPITPTSVPEPDSTLGLAVGLFGAGSLLKRKLKKEKQLCSAIGAGQR
ncbi:MAG TPA: PEP-CTERM sorting domain-containing protein, partial [Candidatus Obscuribacterales bacterium]